MKIMRFELPMILLTDCQVMSPQEILSALVGLPGGFVRVTYISTGRGSILVAVLGATDSPVTVENSARPDWKNFSNQKLFLDTRPAVRCLLSVRKFQRPNEAHS